MFAMRRKLTSNVNNGATTKTTRKPDPSPQIVESPARKKGRDSNDEEWITVKSKRLNQPKSESTPRNKKNIEVSWTATKEEEKMGSKSMLSS